MARNYFISFFIIHMYFFAYQKHFVNIEHYMNLHYFQTMFCKQVACFEFINYLSFL